MPVLFIPSRKDLGIAMYIPSPASASRPFVTVIYDQFPSCLWRRIGTCQHTVCMEAKESIYSFDGKGYEQNQRYSRSAREREREIDGRTKTWNNASPSFLWLRINNRERPVYQYAFSILVVSVSRAVNLFVHGWWGSTLGRFTTRPPWCLFFQANHKLIYHIFFFFFSQEFGVDWHMSFNRQS